MKNPMFKNILFILAATIWISLSEFVRNQFILSAQWLNHYTNLGLNFPAAPVNGAIWGIWSLMFAIFIFFLSQRFSLMQTTLLAWFIAFPMMWLVLWNLMVLPVSILTLAIPLSLVETAGAAWLCAKHKS